jgi:hypothetical protein
MVGNINTEILREATFSDQFFDVIHLSYWRPSKIIFSSFDFKVLPSLHCSKRWTISILSRLTQF